MKHKITRDAVGKFRTYLIYEEKSAATLEKYTRDLEAFLLWLGKRTLVKTDVLAYKEYLMERYAAASVNSILSALNSFFMYHAWFDCKVKTIKMQKQIFCTEQKELTKPEYEKLLKAALHTDNHRLYHLMQTICATGIRISELRFITVEAVRRGQARVQCKGKMRTVILPRDLCRILTGYIRKYSITSGSVFVSRNGRPLDRSNIWNEMKKLCAAAGVPKAKVFPHNLRHLFARTYYSAQKDIVRLADILGHGNIDTTRIYTVESGEIHRRQMQRLGLVHMNI